LGTNKNGPTPASMSTECCERLGGGSTPQNTCAQEKTPWILQVVKFLHAVCLFIDKKRIVKKMGGGFASIFFVAQINARKTKPFFSLERL